LAQALQTLPKEDDPNLLVGLNTADDAGVYRLRDDLALVLTVDMLAPFVEDPYAYGQIAAANSVSDVYAMGGEPKIALNIAAYSDQAPIKDLSEILRGGQDKAREAGVTIAGGHTFKNSDIKYGMAVIGYVHPDRIVTNAGARPGDVIILTKPLGTGTINQAYFTGRIELPDMAETIAAMTRLNKEAAEAMRKAGAHAATDITGYGLAGHLAGVARASGCGVELHSSRIPFHNAVFPLYQDGVRDTGIEMNKQSFGALVENRTVKASVAELIFGSETSGGLAVVVPEFNIPDFEASFGSSFSVIGRVTDENPGRIVLLP
jgi:selenide,water dikinase